MQPSNQSIDYCIPPPESPMGTSIFVIYKLLKETRVNPQKINTVSHNRWKQSPTSQTERQKYKSKFRCTKLVQNSRLEVA